MKELKPYFQHLPIMAILRGLQPEEAKSIGTALYEQGVRAFEVPLNKPNAMATIAKLIEVLPDDTCIGAGTVLSISQVNELIELGADIAVSPHTNVELVEYTLQQSICSIPGFYTPSEAMESINAGAKWLKLFPAGSLPLQYLTQVKSILSEETKVMPVGGINAQNINGWLAAGADAFGIGGELYRVGDNWREVSDNLTPFIKALSRPYDSV